jgi:hypothetical protein
MFQHPSFDPEQCSLLFLNSSFSYTSHWATNSFERWYMTYEQYDVINFHELVILVTHKNTVTQWSDVTEEINN